jgi:hypothetical protein
MKIHILLVLALFSLVAGAKTLPLRPGDVLLQPLNCWSCFLIEAQEESIYSHMGVVLAVEPEIVIAESLGTVRKVSLKEFDKKTERGQKIMVLRFRNEKISAAIEADQPAFMKLFVDEFEGAAYDSEFLWNNFDESGREKFYCSEMVSKFLHYYIGIDMPIKRMKYDKYREHWITYFRGTPPDGKWGNAPADFDRSELFYRVGEL